MRLWLIPFVYAIGSFVCGRSLPRIEHYYFGSYAVDMSVASTQALLAAVASGMMALTGIVFSIAFVMVQFSAIAYSPRLVLWFARDPRLFHSLGPSSPHSSIRSRHSAGSIGQAREKCLCSPSSWSSACSC
jgi:uncharacterized membrane protein